MKRILFQGDSITDAGRNREDFYAMGGGYPNLVKATLGTQRPQDFEFLNRGISGNRIVDLYARIKMDFINLAPDIASIYVGVNDVWHELSRQNGVDTEKFVTLFEMLLTEVATALPNCKLFLLSPFVLPGSATVSETDASYWERFQSGVAEKAAACKQVAERFCLPLIDLQSVFDKACQSAAPTHWTVDGVHPTICGHMLICREYLSVLKTLE